MCEGTYGTCVYEMSVRVAVLLTGFGDLGSFEVECVLFVGWSIVMVVCYLFWACRAVRFRLGVTAGVCMDVIICSLIG